MGNCLLCNHNVLTPVIAKYKYTSDIFNDYFPNITIGQCEKCGLHQVIIDNSEKNKELLNQYYCHNYGIRRKGLNFSNHNNILWVRGKSIAKIAKKYIDQKNICVFEKGAGLGFNLYHLSKMFKDATLYTDEMDEYTQDILEEIGVKKLPRDIESQSFDMIVCSHVLEHLLEPMETLMSFYWLLKSNGILYVEIPNDLCYEEPHLTFWNRNVFEWMISTRFSDCFIIEDMWKSGLMRYKPNNDILSKACNFSIKALRKFHYLFYNIKNKNGDTIKVILRKI